MRLLKNKFEKCHEGYQKTQNFMLISNVVKKYLQKNIYNPTNFMIMNKIEKRKIPSLFIENVFSIKFFEIFSIVNAVDQYKILNWMKRS